MNLKFGRLPYVHNPLVPQMRAVLHQVPLNPLPGAVDYLRMLPADMGVLSNDSVGDCAEAGAYHAFMIWLKGVSDLVNIEPDTNVLKFYSELTGYDPSDPSTDTGTNIQYMLKYLMNVGAPVGTLGGRRKIIGYVETDPRHLDDLRRVIWECGCAIVGLNMRENIIPQMGPPPDVWDVDASAAQVGLHCVVLGAYDGAGFKAVSWGRNAYYLTEAFLQDALEESYGVISGDWVSGFTGKTPLGQTLEQWQALMQPLQNSPST